MNYFYGKSSKKIEKWGKINGAKKHGKYSCHNIMKIIESGANFGSICHIL